MEDKVLVFSYKGRVGIFMECIKSIQRGDYFREKKTPVQVYGYILVKSNYLCNIFQWPQKFSLSVAVDFPNWRWWWLHISTHIFWYIYSHGKGGNHLQASKLYGTCHGRTGGKFQPGRIVNQVTVTIECVDTSSRMGMGMGMGMGLWSGSGSATPNGMRS